MQRFIFFLIIPLLFISNSCKKSENLSLFHSFPGNTWNRFEKLEFNFQIDDISIPYDVSLILRHSDPYPFDNLYIHVIMYLPGGEERIAEYDFDVKNPEGEFLSEKKNGYREIIYVLRKGLRIYQEGNCMVEIENLIPKIEITGITGLGIMLEQSKEK